MKKLKWIYRKPIHYFGYIDRNEILVVTFMIFIDRDDRKKYELAINGSRYKFKKLSSAKKVAQLIHKA